MRIELIFMAIQELQNGLLVYFRQGSVLNFMRIEYCDILYIGIVYSNPDLKILELNE